MAEANGYSYYHFYSTMWILDGHYGLGILSKYPVIEVSSKLLPNSLFKEPRILTKTKIAFGNKEVDIYNTHLTYENNDFRISQMSVVIFLTIVKNSFNQQFTNLKMLTQHIKDYDQKMMILLLLFPLQQIYLNKKYHLEQQNHEMSYILFHC